MGSTYWNYYWTVTTMKSNYFREGYWNKASKVDTTHYRFRQTGKDFITGDDFFCTIGTTIKKKQGSKKRSGKLILNILDSLFCHSK
jgi:hypothetical protein